MNEAEKFKRKTIKIIEIDEVKFTIRKLNPHDSHLMGKNIPKREYEKIDGKFKLDDKGEKTPIPFTRDQLEEMGDKDQRISLTRAVLNPKIVEKEYGQEKDDEIPYDLVDDDTATKLSNAIVKFSLSMFEDEEVGVKPFPEKPDGKNIDDDSPELKDTPLNVGGSLRARIGTTVKDSSG